jgi:hypothetical protein
MAWIWLLPAGAMVGLAALTESVALLLLGLVTACGGLVAGAIFFGVFFDLRVRKDGLDVDHLVELVDQIETRARPGSVLDSPRPEPFYPARDPRDSPG